ncbi:MAG: Nif11-like leader peptide family natural product precursor [Holophagales bacterium]|nr:Nif11-like leader peptide family natural product precursor [Holophagales bacterium]
MSFAEVSRFVRDLRNDPVLLEQFSGGQLGLEGLVEQANGQGYRFTSAEARSFADAQKVDPSAQEGLEMSGSDDPGDPGLPALISIVNQPVVILIDPGPKILIEP